jgi:hypothetical protein
MDTVMLGIDFVVDRGRTFARLLRDGEVRAVLATFDHVLTEEERAAFVEEAKAVVGRTLS